MKFAKSIPYPDLRSLLTDPTVTAIEQRIADMQGLQILPNETITWLQQTLSAANVDLDSAHQMLEDEREDLLKWCVAVVRDEALNNERDSEEFPPGEGADGDSEDDNVTVLGIANGVALSRMCEYYCLRHRTYDDLIQYLKWARIPYHRKYASQLRRIYRAQFQ